MTASLGTEKLASLLKVQEMFEIGVEYGPMRDIMMEIAARVDSLTDKSSKLDQTQGTSYAVEDFKAMNARIDQIQKQNERQNSDFNTEVRELKAFFQFQLKDLREKYDKNINQIATMSQSHFDIKTPQDEEEQIKEIPDSSQIERLTSEIDTLRARFENLLHTINSPEFFARFVPAQPIITPIDLDTPSPKSELEMPTQEEIDFRETHRSNIEQIDPNQGPVSIPTTASTQPTSPHTLEPLTVNFNTTKKGSGPDPRVDDLLLQIKQIQNEKKADGDKLNNTIRTVNKMIQEMEAQRKDIALYHREIDGQASEFDRIYDKMAESAVDNDRKITTVNKTHDELVTKVDKIKEKLDLQGAALAALQSQQIPNFDSVVKKLQKSFTDNMDDMDSTYRQQIHYLRLEVTNLKEAVKSLGGELPETEEPPFDELGRSRKGRKKGKTINSGRSSSSKSGKRKLAKSAQQTINKSKTLDVNENPIEDKEVRASLSAEQILQSVNKDMPVIEEQKLTVLDLSDNFTDDDIDNDTTDDFETTSSRLPPKKVIVVHEPPEIIIEYENIFTQTTDYEIPVLRYSVGTPNGSVANEINSQVIYNQTVDNIVINKQPTRGNSREQSRHTSSRQIPSNTGSQTFESVDINSVHQSPHQSDPLSQHMTPQQSQNQSESTTELTTPREFNSQPGTQPISNNISTNGSVADIDMENAYLENYNTPQKIDSLKPAGLPPSLSVSSMSSIRPNLSHNFSFERLLNLNIISEINPQHFVSDTGFDMPAIIDQLSRMQDDKKLAPIKAALERHQREIIQLEKKVENMQSSQSAVGKPQLISTSHVVQDPHKISRTRSTSQKIPKPNVIEAKPKENQVVKTRDIQPIPIKAEQNPIQNEGNKNEPAKGEVKPQEQQEENNERPTTANLDGEQTITIRFEPETEPDNVMVHVVNADVEPIDESKPVPMSGRAAYNILNDESFRKAYTKIMELEKLVSNLSYQVSELQTPMNTRPTTQVDNRSSYTNVSTDTNSARTPIDDNRMPPLEDLPPIQQPEEEELHEQPLNPFVSPRSEQHNHQGPESQRSMKSERVLTNPQYDDQFRILRDAIVDLRSTVQKLKQEYDKPIPISRIEQFEERTSNQPQQNMNDEAIRALRRKVDSQFRDYEEQLKNLRREMYEMLKSTPQERVIEKPKEEVVEEKPKVKEERQEKPKVPKIGQEKIFGPKNVYIEAFDSPRVIKILSLDVPQVKSDTNSPRNPKEVKITKNNSLPDFSEIMDKTHKVPRKSTSENEHSDFQSKIPDTAPAPAPSPKETVPWGHLVPQPIKEVTVLNEHSKQDIVSTIIPFLIELRNELLLKIDSGSERIRVLEAGLKNKVDKEFVNDFFRKIRTTINDLKNQMDQIKQTQPDKVTHEELKDMAADIYNSLTKETQAPAGKTSYNCLFCGQPINKVTDPNDSKGRGKSRGGVYGSEKQIKKPRYGRPSISSKLQNRDLPPLRAATAVPTPSPT